MKPFNLIECIQNGGNAVDKGGRKYQLVGLQIATKSLKFMLEGKYPFYYHLDGRLNCQDQIAEDKTLYLPEPSDNCEPFDIAKYMTGKYAVTTRRGDHVGNLIISTGEYTFQTTVDGHAERYRLDGTYSADGTPHFMDLVLRKK